jgi:hypothetical protein
MIYPLGGGDAECATQPLITMKDIVLRNITSHGGILPPGIIRNNETNPGTGFVWDNVHIHGWWRILGLGFITEYTSGTVTNSHPVPRFTNLGLVEPTISESILTAILNIFETAWEQLFSGDLFTPVFNPSEQLPSRRHGWQEKPWEAIADEARRDERHGRNHGPEDR